MALICTNASNRIRYKSTINIFRDNDFFLYYENNQTFSSQGLIIWEISERTH